MSAGCFEGVGFDPVVCWIKLDVYTDVSLAVILFQWICIGFSFLSCFLSFSFYSFHYIQQPTMMKKEEWSDTQRSYAVMHQVEYQSWKDMTKKVNTAS